MLLAPEGIGAHAVVAHHAHALGMAEPNHVGQKVVLQPRLRRHDPAFVPGIAVARHGEGLDDVRPQPFVPADVVLGRGVGPDPRAREPVNPLGPPVEVDAEGFDGSLRLSLGHATCCRGPGRTRNEDHEQQAAGCFHGRVFRFIERSDVGSFPRGPAATESCRKHYHGTRNRWHPGKGTGHWSGPPPSSRPCRYGEAPRG